MPMPRTAVTTSSDGAAFTLRHPALLRWISIAAVFGGTTGFALAGAIAPSPDPVLAGLNVAGVMILGTCGMALLWESFRWSLTVTPQGLECNSPWKPRRMANWGDVTSVTYSRLHHWHVLRFADGGSFRVPAVVPGVSRLLDVCKTKVPAA